MESFINEKFSTRAKSALKLAQSISRELKHGYIGTEHLLYGIVSETGSFASKVLLKNRLSALTVRLELIRGGVTANHSAAIWIPKLSENLQKSLVRAAVMASKYQYQFIGTEHFLFGIVDASINQAQNILNRLNVQPKEIHRNLMSIFENPSKFPEMSGGARERGRDSEEATATSSALDYFALDLTQKAKSGLIDPVIGREKEIERLISILNRRTKNNPVLIGDPGVGKTAIVEGLALAIRERRVPDTLLGKRILSLDLALIVAGTMFRGEFENRLKQIIEEVKETEDIILFIDELHTVVGAGATTGSLDAANILKPALARGELRAIGATTLSEYKKHIEPDAALERRFQPIVVKEPTPEETLQILHGLRPKYEAHHGIEITDEALKRAVYLSNRYLTDRFLPDKAIDLVDETAAFHKTTQNPKSGSYSLSKIERDLSDLSDQKKQAVFHDQDFSTAKALKQRESKLFKSRQKIYQNKGKETVLTGKIDAIHVAQTVGRITGIPVQDILLKESQKLLLLEKNMKKQIVGQDEAIREIAAAIRRSRAGISSPTKPLGSFMFLGPSGVGKTLTAKILARELFGDEQALVRIDMSELMEKHNVARLIGAPAGYVGYEEGGRLTESIKRRPYAVVLFDEIEKAHPDVLNMLLQILDEGHLTDASGKQINFRNTTIIMTSNIGLSSLNRWAKNFGFAETTSKKTDIDAVSVNLEVLSKVREHFRPEFLNRIDKILVFNPLTKKHFKNIISLELKKLQNQLAEQQIKLDVMPQTVSHLAEKSFDPKEGARQIRKSIQNLIEDEIAQKILRGELNKKKKLVVNVRDEKINLEIA